MLLALIQIIATAINELFDKYKSMMMDLSFSILNDYQHAEDAVQEALISLSKNMDKIDSIDSNRSRNYVYSVTKNMAISIYRKRKNDAGVQFSDFDALSNMKGNIDIDVFRNKYGFSDEIIAALSQLEEQDKDIICYKFGDGYSGKEIARIMHQSPDYIYKRMQRAIAKLDKILNEMKRMGQ